MKMKILGTATAIASFDHHWPSEHVLVLEENVKREALLKLLPFIKADIDILNEKITVHARLFDYE